jgi:hypothetical protein
MTSDSILYADHIVGRQGVGSEDAIHLPDDTVIDIPGSMVQYKQTVFKGQFTNTTSASLVQVTGLDCSIQPRFNDSLILAQWQIHAGVEHYQWQMKLRRDGSDISGALGTAAGSRPPTTAVFNAYDGEATTSLKYIMNRISGMYLDSPATTSTVTYQCWVGGYSDTLDSHVNRSPRFLDSGDGNYDTCPSSTLSLWEFRP